MYAIAVSTSVARRAFALTRSGSHRSSSGSLLLTRTRRTRLLHARPPESESASRSPAATALATGSETPVRGRLV
jgi:hypothetical protein